MSRTLHVGGPDYVWLDITDAGVDGQPGDLTGAELLFQVRLYGTPLDLDVPFEAPASIEVDGDRALAAILWPADVAGRFAVAAVVSDSPAAPIVDLGYFDVVVLGG